MQLQLSLMGETEAGAIQHYLEKAGKCRCTRTQVGKALYLLRVEFPANTIEKQNSNPDPRHREETIIKLPNGLKLRKVVRWPCVREGCTHTFLFPIKPVEEAEEPRRKNYGARYAAKHQDD